MKLFETRNRRRMMLVLATLTGCTFVSGLLPSCETTLTTFNPCGTVFGFCEPTDIDLMFADLPDYELDPTCTIPYYGFDEDATGGGGGSQNIDGQCATSPIW